MVEGSCIRAASPCQGAKMLLCISATSVLAHCIPLQITKDGQVNMRIFLHFNKEAYIEDVRPAASFVFEGDLTYVQSVLLS